MEKYIPFEKLSKKKQRELNAKKRSTWGTLSPVTRKTQNSKAYNRKKAQNWKEEHSPSDPVPFLYENYQLYFEIAWINIEKTSIVVYYILYDIY